MLLQLCFAVAPLWHPSELGRALVAERVADASESERIATLIVEYANLEKTTMPAREIAKRVKSHLNCDSARRARHDAVVNLISSQLRGRRLLVDKPLSAVGVEMKRTRRVDIVVDESVFIEVTVLATSAGIERAVLEKLKKYKDLDEPIVVAVHAVTGDIYPGGTLRALSEVGVDADALEHAIRIKLASLLSSPLRESKVLDRRRRSVVHVRRAKKKKKKNRRREEDEDQS